MTDINQSLKEFIEATSHRKAFGQMISSAFYISNFNVTFPDEGAKEWQKGCDFYISFPSAIYSRDIIMIQAQAKELKYECNIKASTQYNFMMTFKKI